MISTVNIQHLESPNDVVARITGVRQRETVPDAVRARADQIELVDMTPEALRRRMAHGNIYPAERVDAALGELLPPGQPRRAPRAGAAVGRRPGRRVAAASTSTTTASPKPWETRERVVVAITGAPGRRSTSSGGPRAWRSGRTGELVGVHVAPDDGSRPAPRGRRSMRNGDLLDELGGAYHEVVGDDAAAALAAFAAPRRRPSSSSGPVAAVAGTSCSRGSVVTRRRGASAASTCT